MSFIIFFDIIKLVIIWHYDTRNVEQIHSFITFDARKLINLTLKKIYVSDKFTIENVEIARDSCFFSRASSLIGGRGTKVSNITIDRDLNIDFEYARIDDPDNGKSGILTDITDKPQS